MTQFKIIDKKNPRKNLPKISSKKRTENNFALAFGRSFVDATQESIVMAARELPLQGFGIADFVCVIKKQENISRLIDFDDLSFLAFEIKMKDWRSALAQAFRYKYYANKSVVVLPPNDAENAKEYIKTFKTLGIGLWSFDAKKKNIIQIYTPPIKKPISITANKKALSILIPRDFRSQQYV